MDIDRSVNEWFERISLIQKKADHYKLSQDILSSLSDNDGLDFYIKSKGIIIGAHTCILRCRCPQFYHEIVKNVDISSLPVYLLEHISEFIKCVYSEDDITILENKLIKLINISHSIKNNYTSIDLYDSKRISCDINPLYYSLAHCDDFSSSEFSDFDQCMHDDVESTILNQAIIGNSPFENMDMNSNKSVQSHVVKSQLNNTCGELNVLTNEDNTLHDQCSVNCNINKTDVGNEVNNKSCKLAQHDLIKISNDLDDINSFLNVELPIKCNHTLDLSTNVKNKLNPSTIEHKKNNIKTCKPNFSNDNSLLNETLHKKHISFHDDNSSKRISENDDDLDVVSPHNFETFTIVKKTNNPEDIFCNSDNSNTSNQNELKDESNFQTFTVINENIIIGDHNFQDDLVLNSNDTFESDTSNDFKTFTVVNEVTTSPFHPEQLCSSSNSMSLNNKVFMNNNDIDLSILPKSYGTSQFDTITLLPQSNSQKEEVINNLSKNLIPVGKECNMSTFGIVSSKKETSVYEESCNKVNFKAENTLKKEAINNKNNCEIDFMSKEDNSCTNMKDCNDGTSNKLCTASSNVSENTNSLCDNNLNCRQLEMFKSSDESDSTLSLHMEILENNIRLNSPDSLNGDDKFGHDEEKPIVSNKLEFVPLKATPVKDNRSPRLSRKYMECSPVMSANAYISNVEKPPVTEENNERRNSSSFFIDFNQGIKPKNKPKRFENATKSLDSSTITSSKEKIFSMFIDFNEDSESSESSFKSTKHRKPQTLTDRFVRMHSEDTSIKSSNREDTVTPPPSRMTSTVENSSADISESCKKQSVFMFIENDSPTLVKRRNLPQSSRLRSQRNSWNVDSTVVHKTHHRTHSVNLSEENQLDARMTQSHIETGSKELNKSLNSFDNLKCNVSVTVNSVKDSRISGLTDSFVRLSDMDKAPSQEMIYSLNRCETKSESSRRDLKNTELGRCLKRMFPYLKSTEVERILFSKPPYSLDSKEEIQNGLGQDLLRMFLEEIGADTTIDINGRRIKAHKCVLTSRCQYFAAMFSGGWVQSAGNVLYLKGFSYKTVHLTLRYIYSGECNFSEIKNVAELSKLADMLCLEGLKDNIMLYLAAEYCHFFKEVCERCTIGILECLTLSVAYGLDDLYLSCIVWINDNFSVVWPTNHFVSLPQDLKIKCFKHKVAHIDDLNDVLSVTQGCEKIKRILPNDEWAKEVIEFTTDLSNSVIKYLAKHFYTTITSKYFKQVLESENLFVDSFATHLLASCNCANRNQIRQAYDHLNKTSSNHFWHAQGESLVNAIMELIVKGLASDFRNGREKQAMGYLPNDYRMSETLSQRIAFELGISRLELATNGILITSSPVKKNTTNTRTSNKIHENKIKPKSTVENTLVSKVKTTGKFAEVKSRYMEPKPQITSPSPQKVLSIHKDLPRGRRIMSSSASLTSSPIVRNTISSSRLSTNRLDTGLKTKTSSELSLSTPKTKPRTVLLKTDPLPSSTRTSFVGSKTTTKSVRKPVQNTLSSRKMSSDKTLNGTKKQTVAPKTKSLPNGHPTIGSRSGTFCKDEPTVIHSKDIIS